MSDYYDVHVGEADRLRQRDEFRLRKAYERDEEWRKETRRQWDEQMQRNALQLEAIARNTAALERIVAILEDMLAETKP